MIEFRSNQKLLSIANKKEKSYSGDNYERRTPKWVMKSETYLQAFKGPKTVYDYLWMNVIRAPRTNDHYNVYEDYYCRGQIGRAHV